MGGSRPADAPSGPEGLWAAILERLKRAVAPRYEVQSLLGFGGMAGVYLAHDTRLGRDVAIKVMSPQLMTDPSQIERFRQEARATAKLSHANIVTIHEIDEREGLQYLVMAVVKGEPLGSILKASPDPVELHLAIRWTRQIAEALSHAHGFGIVHRDIKPGNVLIDQEGQALVTDFGIAKMADEPGLTRTGMLVGTPTYMSPEQCESGEVTGASDQYALGILAYQMLTGDPPFSGGTMAVLQAHLNQAPEPPQLGRPDCPDWLAHIVLTMLAKDPDERWPSMTALVEAIRAETPPPPTEPERPMEGAAGNRPIWLRPPALMGMLLVGLIAGGAYLGGWLGSDPAPDTERRDTPVAAEPPDAPGLIAEDAEASDDAPVDAEELAAEPPESEEDAGEDVVAEAPTPAPTAAAPEPEPPAPARVRITTALPAGAQVTAEGPGGTVPVDPDGMELDPGTWVLRLEAPGHLPIEHGMTLEPGDSLEWSPVIVAEAEPEPPVEETPPEPVFDVAAAQAQVASVVEAFVGAFETREMAAVLRYFPTASVDWQDEWRTLITDRQNIRNLETRATGLEHTTTTESRAEVTFTLAFQFTDFRNQRQSQEHRFLALLTGEGDARVLAELTAIP